MKVNVTTKITISASPQSVFAYLSDLNKHYLWNPHLRKISPLGALQDGKEYKTLSTFLGIGVEGKNRVTKFIRNQEIQIENSTGTVQYLVNYRLQEDATKTRLVCQTTVNSSHNSFAFSAPILKLLATRELRSDLQSLKLAVEQGIG
jgi:uncharacterized membrane protein